MRIAKTERIQGHLRTAARRVGLDAQGARSSLKAQSKAEKLGIDEFSGFCEDRPEMSDTEYFDYLAKQEKRKEKWNKFWKSLGDLFKD